MEWRHWQSGSKMAASYRSMHVALMPSRAIETWTEQSGRVIVEAQASGAVVAGYASGSIPEVLGNAGITLPEGDWWALADSITALLPAGLALTRSADRERPRSSR